MAVCLASSMKAQFYDSADDIYYYVLEETSDHKKDNCFIFNFDGKRACVLSQHTSTGTFNTLWGLQYGQATDYHESKDVKRIIKNNPNFFVEKIETLDYDMYYDGSLSSLYEVYIFKRNWNGNIIADKFEFSKDRSFVYVTLDYKKSYASRQKCIRVDKSYFRSGRSRNPSSSLYE